MTDVVKLRRWQAWLATIVGAFEVDYDVFDAKFE